MRHFRRIGRWDIVSLAFAVLPLLAAQAQAAPPQPPADRFATDRVLVAFNESATPMARRAAVARTGLQVDTRVQSEYFVRLTITPGQLAAGMDVQKAIALLKADPNVRVAEPDWIVYGDDIPNDPKFRNQWGLQNTGLSGGTVDADIDAPEAWDVTHGNPALRVAVIDTGVDYTHEDLSENILRDAKGKVIGYDFYNHDADPWDDNGHGTHVAGTIGAVGNNGIGVAGVCWSVTVIPVKFLGSNGSGSTSNAILSVDFARKRGARIMNNSWGGGGFSQLLLEAILRARDQGILFVAAAGNRASNNDLIPHYPASYNRYADNVVSVAATNRYNNIAWYSNYGPKSVDIAAPGSSILSTWPGNEYKYFGGTSMAAPHVAGTAALVLSQYPLLKYWQIKARLMANVDLPVVGPTDLEGNVKSGRLNAAGALVVDDEVPSVPTLFGASQRAPDALLMQWTASGDDRTVGQAYKYDLRISTSPITAEDFLDATPVDGVPDPAPSGTVQSVAVPDLVPGTVYYFALRSMDNGGNLSLVVFATAATLSEGGSVDYFLTKISADVRTDTAGTTVPFKAKLKRADDNAPLVGQRVDFYANPVGELLGSAITDSTGTAKIMVTAPDVGVKRFIIAKFEGDISFAPSTARGSITGK